MLVLPAASNQPWRKCSQQKFPSSLPKFITTCQVPIFIFNSCDFHKSFGFHNFATRNFLFLFRFCGWIRTWPAGRRLRVRCVIFRKSLQLKRKRFSVTLIITATETFFWRALMYRYREIMYNLFLKSVTRGHKICFLFSFEQRIRFGHVKH